MILIWDSGETMEIKFGYDVGGAKKGGLKPTQMIFSIDELTQGFTELGPYKMEEYILKLKRQLGKNTLSSPLRKSK